MEFVKADVRAGNEVCVVCPADGQEQAASFHGATVINLPTTTITRFSPSHSVRFVRMILAALKGQVFDVVIVYEFRGCSLLPLMGKGLGRTWLLNIRNSNLHFSPSLKVKAADWLTSVETRPYTMTVVCDEAIGHQMLGHRQFQVIPNGVDLRKYSSGRRLEMRQALGVSATDKLIVYIGTMVSARRPERMLETFAKVVAVHPEAKFLAVGDGDRMTQMATWVNEHGLADRVIMPGRVDYEIIQDYVAAADIGLAYYPALSNFQQNIPLKTAELLGAGLPVVATNTQGNRLYITHEYNGLLAGDDPNELAKAILRLLDDPMLVAALCKNARASVMQYDWDCLAQERLLPLYLKYAPSN
jgi:glycosyltransferase involved in cell wall biosynthesis